MEGQGSHAHVHGIVNGLTRLGWQVTLWQPAVDARRRGLLARMGGFLQVQRRLVLAPSPPDVIYVRMHPAALPAVRWARRRGLRVVVEVNGGSDDWLLAWPSLRRVAWLLRLALRAELRAADAVIAVTDGLAAWVRAEAGSQLPVSVVPNGVDVDRFTPDADGGPDRLPPRYAVFVGALAPWQGLHDLVAARRHPEWPDGVALVVAGDGALRALVDQSDVVWLGAVPFAQVPGLLTRSIAALVPSRDRTGTGVAPIKLFEAMGCGVPVVAADVADTNRYATGPLVRPGDVGGWARAVAMLAADRDAAAAAGRRGRQAAVAQHSWDARAAATHRVLMCGS